jgi:hypothetical protein
VSAGTTQECPGTLAYEELRAWATARPRASRSPPGALVFLRRGLAAWLRESPRLAFAPRQRAPQRPGVGAASGRDQALAAVLVSMIERCQREASR